MVAQTLWLPGMWAFLTAARVTPKARALALAVTILSVAVILHSFYVWPKLLPTCFLLLVAAFFLTDRHRQSRASLATGALVGLASGYSLLSHTGSAFALAAIGATMVALKRLPSWRCALAAVTMLAAVQVPWTLYQQYVDPPGDRLLKWHLAGADEVDNRSAIAAIVDSYASADGGTIAANKLSNFRRLIGEPLAYAREIGRFVRPPSDEDPAAQRRVAGGQVRSVMFFHFVPALGLMAVGPLVLTLGLVRRRLGSANGRTALICWLTVAFGLVVWCLLMFGPNATNVHEGTLVTVVLAFVGSSLALSAVAPRAAYLVGFVQIVWSLSLLALATPSSQSSDQSIDPVVGTLAGVSLVLLLAVMTRADPPAEEACAQGTTTSPRVLLSSTI